MKVREAIIEDWDELLAFYSRVYRENHPLQNKEFWRWQYGNVDNGRAFICINNQGRVVGHVGANFGGDLAWIINVFLDPECRGKGVLRKLYDLARQHYPLAATAANEAGLGLYRNMRWFRYHDLIRFVKTNPIIKNLKIENIVKEINVELDSLIFENTDYLQQPGIKGIRLKEGSIGVSQESVGGLRIVDINNLGELEEEAWSLGYLWIDYITSWNDLKCKELEKNGWVLDFNSVVPWRLNPIEEGFFCNITFLSEEPLNKEFIVHRSYSDHGRIGSL